MLFIITRFNIVFSNSYSLNFTLIVLISLVLNILYIIVKLNSLYNII